MQCLQNTEVKLIHENYKNGTWELPKYKTMESAGLDLRAAIDEPLYLTNKTPTIKIPLGLSIWLNNPNYMFMFAPKSGIGCNKNLVLSNTIGIIDSDYQGQWGACVQLNNPDDNFEFVINPGDFICQAVIVSIIQLDLNTITIVDEFSNISERGSDGGINRNNI
jgi:dUTP pyrophosphatase